MLPAHLNLSAFKYPLGFIRVIEFVFIIIAIAAVNSWGLTFDYDCPTPPNNQTIKASVATFSLSNFKIKNCSNAQQTLWDSDDSAGGAAGFFYFVNVSSLIYVIIVTFVYVIFWSQYQSEKRIALLDLGITALFFILFFFCSSIWWAGSNTIGNATSEEHLKERFAQEPWKNQTVQLTSRDVNNGKLAISVLANWVCVFSFAFNCWFIWKEVVPRDSSDPTSIA
ncbi:unnamed protein product [Caenorhabditis angaria]|uniref:MARVEL domain-containing protein n=1 Tax=Caenorhabditis angaria TaxID=860376 RepID=A0A9P1IQ10_9PELO|nr:unnamed protein product [Caenorhabditis angaria]